MSAQNIEARVARVISETAGLPLADVKPEATLAELGIDSLTVTDLELELEREFDLMLPDSIEDATVEQICAAVRTLTEVLA